MVHGGPGLSGLRIFLPAFRSELAHNRDLVIYDQRGSGYSEPKFCPKYTSARDSALLLRTLEEREKFWDRQDRECIAWLHGEGIDVSAYNTVASAADLIDLRKALGYEKWDVYSGSYGARLAQEAIRQDPAGIRSVVLASPVTRGPATQAEVALSTQRALEKVWTQCAAQPVCSTAFPTVSADFFALYDDLTKSPYPVTFAREGSTSDTIWLDGRRLLGMIREHMLGRPGRLARLPLLLKELRRGDRQRAAQTLVGYDTTSTLGAQQIVIHLVNCYDVYGPVFRRMRDSVYATANKVFRNEQLNDCEKWQTSFADSTEYAPVRTDIPVLLTTGRFDDRTPTEHAKRIAATLAHAYLFEFPNEGHDARPVGCHLSILTQFFDNPSRAPDAACIASIPEVQFVTTWDSQ
jgi:pimeloyl-ACP methyl ester carboxylesterase